MRQQEIDFIRSCVLTERTKFYYFKDRYALMLLSYVVGEGMDVRALKQTRFAGLLDKLVVKRRLATVPSGRLEAQWLWHTWDEPTECYRLTLSQWGEAKACDSWTQTSRPGFNLVLCVNFSSRHNTAYRRCLGPRSDHPFVSHFVPDEQHRELTMAWVRLDIDLDGGEAIIEEVQSDWVREVLQAHRDLNREGLKLEDEVPSYVGLGECRVRQFERYVREGIGPHRRTWSEVALAAGIWFLRDVLGVRRIYYHTFESCLVQKDMRGWHPPRSIYTDLPRQFRFELTTEPPRLLVNCRDRRVRKRLSQPDVQWFLLDIQ